MMNLGDFTTSDTLYVPFGTYDSDGASVTITGLATTDIEIYKDGSTTQRSSDNGYSLLDTDGIDFDGNTGIHGFSIDLSDDSDAGFYAAGSTYWIVVSSITVDGQTVNFVYYFTIGMLLKPSIAGRTLGVESDGDLTKVNTLDGHTAQTGDSFARIGANGASLTAIPWNSAWDTEVQSECNDALVALGLDHLLSAAVVGADVTDNSIFAKLVSSGATADWDDYVNTSDSLQAIRDHIGDGTNLTEAGGTGDHLTAIVWNSAWDTEVQSEVQDAIEANHLDHLLAVDYDPASKPGTATALLNELVENDSGVSRFTANALEQGPGGGGGTTNLTTESTHIEFD